MSLSRLFSIVELTPVATVTIEKLSTRNVFSHFSCPDKKYKPWHTFYLLQINGMLRKWYWMLVSWSSIAIQSKFGKLSLFIDWFIFIGKHSVQMILCLLIVSDSYSCCDTLMLRDNGLYHIRDEEAASSLSTLHHKQQEINNN